MRTVIYARYSSHAQNKLSTAQQVDLCRARADREGWTIVGVYADEAISGAAGIGESARPQLAAALAAIEAGQAEQLLAESTDRIARHQGDAYAVRERLDYAGARLFTLLDGVVDDITGTIKGLFDARFRKDLRARVLRGQRSSVGQGRSPAGLAYGYRIANQLDGRGGVMRGLRAIDEEQAAIVRRIFAEYDRGESPRAIAERLNAEQIAAPRGGTWRTTTIMGDRQRGNGMLQNPLYAGELVHFRTRKLADPATRKSRIKPNGAEAHARHQVPELRIVDQDLWERVQARRQGAGPLRPDQQRRPKRLLSGLAVCGLCGGAWTVIGRERWGCGRHRDGRGCANNRTIITRLLEERVLGGLEARMLHPDAVDAFVRTYRKEFARRAAAERRDRDGLDARIRELDTRIDRLIELLTDPRLDGIVEIAGKLSAAKHEREQVKAAIAELGDLQSKVVELHPGLADQYRRQLGSLSEALTGSPQRQSQAAPIIRSLIDRVVILPDPERQRGVTIEISGRLASILALATGSPLPGAPSPMYVNAGAGRGDRSLSYIVRATV